MKTGLNEKELESWKRGDMIPASLKHFKEGKWEFLYCNNITPLFKVRGYNGILFLERLSLIMDVLQKEDITLF